MLTLPHVAIVTFLLTGVAAYSGLREELLEATAAWTEAINQHDVEKAALIYTEDCSMIAPRSAAHGRDGVKKILKTWFDLGMEKVALVVEEVGPTDATDTAYDRSSWTVFDVKGNIMVKGKQMVIWKKVEGVWLVHVDTLNSDFSPQPDTSDDTLKAELAALDEVYCAAWKAQDFPTVGLLYTEDARLMTHEHHTIQGRQAILEMIETMKNNGVTGIDMRSEEAGYLGLSKDMAYERGYYSLLQSDGKPVEEGKCVALWKKVKGQWKVYVHIWSTNTPPEKAHDEL